MTAAWLAALAPVTAHANPTGGTVSAGQATIAASGSTLNITQSTDRAVIDWHGFDIGAGETTQFIQPSSSSVTLNRVGGSGASVIDGNLLANGNIFIINPNGVLFGRGSHVDVNGLVATTADIKNSDFMAGNFNFTIPGNPNASIVNNGMITAKEAGLVGLVAPNVINNGIIAAKAGRVQLASGDTTTVDLYGDGLMEVAVSDQVKSQLVENNGIIAAKGGTIALTAAAGREVVDSVVNVNGKLEAQSVGMQNGRIIISAASPNATVNVAGTISATGKHAGETGGSVSVIADNVNVKSTAVIDASGAAGGGTVLVGGDIHGTGAQTAKNTIVAQGATIKADATQDGDGGKIIVWADDNTDFAGTVWARGIGSGVGGFLETSGKINLTVSGMANLTDAQDNAGTWLLDPATITIYNRTQTGTDGVNTYTTAALETMSAGSNVALVASNTLTLDMTGDTMTLANNRNLSLTATSGNLTSASAGSITTQGTGTVSLTAGGVLDLGTHAVSITSGGNVTTSSVGNTTLGAITTSAGKTVSATVTGAGNKITTSTIATGANGKITLISDDITIGGALSGTGTLILQQNSANRETRINTTAETDDGTAYYLDTGELANLTHGWATIQLGSSSSTQGMRIGTATFTDPVTFLDSSNYFEGGLLTGTNFASFRFATTGTELVTSATAGITTAGGLVTLSILKDQPSAANSFAINTNNGAVTIGQIVNDNGGGVTINAGSGNISVGAITNTSTGQGTHTDSFTSTGTVAFTSTISNATGLLNLTVNAGNLTNGGGWGTAAALGNVNITSTGAITLPAITAANLFINDTNSVTGGATILTGGLDLEGAGGSYTFTSTSNSIANVAGNTGTVSLNEKSGGTMNIGTVNGTTGLTATNLYLNTAGSTTVVTQNAAITATNLLLQGSGTYTLTLLGNAISELASLGTSTINYLQSAAFDIGTVNGTNGLTAKNAYLSSTGTVTQSQAINLTAGLLLQGTGNYTLTNAGNSIANLAANLTGTSSTLDFLGGTYAINTVNSVVGVTAPNVYLNSTGTVTGSQKIVATNLLLQGAAATYNLINTTNAITKLAANGVTQVQLTENSGFDIGTVNGINGVTATNVFLSSTNTVTQSQPIIATNLALIGTAGNYQLTNASNATSELASSGLTTLNFVSNGGFDIGTVNGTVGIGTTVLTNAYLSTGGTVTQSQRISATNLALQGVGNWVLTNAANSITTFAANTGAFNLFDNKAISVGTVSVAGNPTITGLTFTGASTLATGGTMGDITFANNVNWSGKSLFLVEAERNIKINAGVTLANSYTGTFGPDEIPVLLGLRSDANGIDNVGSFNNLGTINFANSSGAVSIFYDISSGTYAAGTQTGRVGWTAPTNETVSSQFTAYQTIESANEFAWMYSGNYALGKTFNGAGGAFAANTPIYIAANAILDGQYCMLTGGSACAINNFTFTASGSNVAPFADVAGGAILRNFGFNLTVSGDNSNNNYSNTGGLVADLEGTIANVTGNGSVTATTNLTNNVGGLVGILTENGRIDRSSYNGTVSDTTTAPNNSSVISVGGLVGSTYSGTAGDAQTIVNSFSNASITAHGGTASADVGGLIGYFSGYDTPGLNLLGTSYFTGSVSGSGNGVLLGGLIGSVGDSRILNSYSTGTVTLTGWTGYAALAGIVGSADNSSIANTYASGLLTGQGGVAGVGTAGNTTNGGTITGSYYDTQTTGATGGTGGGVGKTTAQLQAALPTGWDPSIWTINAGASYPYLVSQGAVQYIGGFVYNALTGGTAVSGASVATLINGTSIGDVTTGANGYYYRSLTNGTLTGTQQVLTYLDGATPGLAFQENAGGTLPAMNIYQNSLDIFANSNNFATTLTNLGVAQGSNTGSPFIYTNSGGLTMTANKNALITFPYNELINSPITVTGTGTLVLNTPNTVTQSSAIAAPNLLLKGTGTYTLTNTGNNFTSLAGNTGTVNLDAGGHFIFIDSIAGVNGLTATNFYLTDTGGGGEGSALNVTNLELFGSGGPVFNFGSVANNIGTLAGDLNVAAASQLKLNNGTNNLVIGSVNGVNGIAATEIDLTTTGTVTQSQAITATSLDLLGTTGTYTLTNTSNNVGTLAGNTGTISLVDGTHNLSIGTVNGTNGVTTTAGLTLTDTGTVTQTQGITTNLLTLLGTGGTWTLTNTGNAVSAFASGTANGTINLNDGATALSLGTIGGTNFYLSDTGNTTQTGVMTVTNLELSGTGANYQLTQQNRVTNIASDIGATGTLNYGTFNDLNIGTVNSVAGVNAGTFKIGFAFAGNVTQSAAITAPIFGIGTGGGNIGTTLTNTGNNIGLFGIAAKSGVVQLNNGANNLVLGNVTGFASGVAAGEFDLTDTGTVTQTKPIILTTGGGLDLLGTGGIFTLTDTGNVIANLAGNTGTVTLNDNANALSIGTVNGTVGMTATNLYLTDTNTVTQVQALSATNLDLLGSAATYTLTNTGNTIGTLAGSVGTGTINLNNGANNVSIGTVNSTNGVTAANLYLTDTGTVSQTQAITATNADLLGTAGTYTLTNASNNLGTLAGNTGTINLNNGAHALSIGTVNGTVGVTATNLYLTDTGAVTQAQAITATNADLLGSAGTYTLSNTGNNITTLAGNVGTGTINLNNGANGIAIGTVNSTAGITAGEFDLATTGVATQTGVINATGVSVTGTGGIFNFGATNAIGTFASGTGVTQIALVDGGDIAIGTVNGNTGVHATNFFLTDTGNVTQSQGITASNLDLLGTGGNYTLTNSGNNVGILAGNTGSVNLVNGNNNLSVSATNGTTGLTTAGDTTLNAGSGTITVAQPIAVGAHNLSLTSDDIALNAAISGTGTLTLQPNDPARAICINYASGACASANYGLSTTELTKLTDGWSAINIGRTNGTADVDIGANTFTDPVTFWGGRKQVFGTLSGTGNGAFTFQDAYNTDLYAGIFTAGGNIDFSNDTYTWFSATPTIATNGGNASFSKILLYSGNGNSLTVNTANGNIAINDTIYNSGGGGAGKTLTLSAGTGTIAFGNTVNTGANISATGSAITFGGAWGASSPLGNVTLNSTNALTLPAFTLTAGNTFSATVTGAGNSITENNAIATGAAGNITLTADDLTLGGALSGTGTVTLQPNSTTRVIDINTTGTNDFNLTPAEIAELTDGWSSIVIGRTDNTGNMNIGAITFTDPVLLSNGARRSLNGNITGTGNASIKLNGPNSFTNAIANITTAGGDITVNGTSLNLNGDSTLTSNGGNITIANNVEKGNSGVDSTLTLNAGTGAISFGNTVYDTTANLLNINATGNSIAFNGSWGPSGNVIGNVTLNSVASLALPTITTTAGKTVNVTVTGAGNKITSGSIATGAGGNITLTSDDLTLNGNLSGTGTLTLAPETASRAVDVNYTGTGDYNLSTAELGHLTDGWGTINIGRTDGTGTMNIQTATFTDPVNFLNNSEIFVQSPLTGTGNASFNFAGNSSNYTVTNANAAITTAGGNVTFGDDLYTYGGSITTNGGNIAGTRLFMADPGVTLATSGGNITFTGNVLDAGTTAASLLSANAGSGTFTLGSTLDFAGSVNATAGTFSLAGAWGGFTPVGNVTLTSANSLTLPAITTAAGKTVSATVTGAGNSITTGAIATGTGGNITLTSDTLTLGGNLSGTGTLTLAPYSTTQLTDVNYDVAGAYNLDTPEIAHLVDGWSQINIGNASSTVDLNIAGTTFTDPVNFRNSFRKTIHAGNTLTGTGNAAFTFTGGWVDISGAITTAGQNVTFNTNYISGYNGVAAGDSTITTNGGNIVTPVVHISSVGNGLKLLSDGGNITVGDYVTTDGNTSGKTFLMNAGTGTVSFGSTVDGAENITASGSGITFGGIWGGGTPLGAVSLTSTNALSLPSITASSIFAQTTGATSDLTLGSGTILTASGSGNAITLVTPHNFIDNASSSNLALTGSGRWLVYSTDPTDTTGEQNLANDFNRYSCAYSSVGTCAANVTLGATVAIPTSGNGLIYSYTPTITATPNALADITYGDAANLTGYGYTLTGYRTGDSAKDTVTGSLTGSSTYTQGSDVGTYNVNYNSGSLASAEGYAVSYANASAAINVVKRIISATLTGAVNKEYDGNADATLAANNYSLSNVYSTDDVGITNTAGSYNDKNAANGKNVTVSSLALGGAKAGNYSLSATSVVGAVGNIAKKALTIVASAAGKVYDAATGTTATLSDDRVAGDVFTDSYTAANFVNPNAGTGKTVNVTGISIAGTDAGNYTFNTSAAPTATITQKQLDVTLANQGITYGDSIPTDTYTYNGFEGTDTATSGAIGTAPVVASAHSGIVDAGSYTGNYTASGGAATNYSFNYIAGNLTVGKATLYVTGDNKSVSYGTGAPTASFTYSGFVNNEDASVLNSAATVASTVTPGTIVNAGSYSNNYVTSGGSDNNYTYSYVPGSLTVTALGLNAIAANQSITYGASTPTTSISYTGFVNGDSATNVITSAPTLASANNGVVDAGTYTGNYSLSGGTTNGNYTFNYIPGDLTVGKATLNVIADNQTITYGATVPTGTYHYSGFVNNDTSGVLDSAPLIASAQTGTPDAGSYANNYTLSGGSDNNYTYSFSSGNLNVSQRALNVYTNSLSKQESDPNPTYTGSNDLLAADAALVSWAYAPTGYTGLVGTYQITATATDTSNRLANYIRSNTYGNLTVLANTGGTNPTVPTFDNNGLPDTVVRTPQTTLSDDSPLWNNAGQQSASLFSDTGTMLPSGVQPIYSYLPVSTSTAYTLQKMPLISASPELLESMGIGALPI